MRIFSEYGVLVSGGAGEKQTNGLELTILLELSKNGRLCDL